MHKIDTSTRERITTGRGPMDLDGGALRVKEAVRVFTLATIGAGAGTVGLLGGALFGRLAIWAGYGTLSSACSIIAAGFTLAGALAWSGSGFLVGVYVWRVVAHQVRLDHWHRAELAAYRAAGGLHVDRQASSSELTIQRPADVINVALSLAERARRGDLAAPSVAAMTGDIWVGRVKFGALTKRQAEQFLQALQQVGVVENVKAGRAGRLTTVEPHEIIELVTTRAGRIKTPPPQLPEPIGQEG